MRAAAMRDCDHRHGHSLEADDIAGTQVGHRTRDLRVVRRLCHAVVAPDQRVVLADRAATAVGASAESASRTLRGSARAPSFTIERFGLELGEGLVQKAPFPFGRNGAPGWPSCCKWDGTTR